MTARNILTVDLLMSMVEFDPNTGCYLWIGGTVDGYGVIKVSGRSVKVHRASWEAHRGSIPPGLCVLHHCDTRPCINVDHLFLGTRTDNNADMDKKGRRRSSSQPGVSHGMAKLTEAQVRTIRAAYRPRIVTYDMLAAQFGVSRTNVILIVTGRAWTHLLTGEP